MCADREKTFFSCEADICMRYVDFKLIRGELKKKDRIIESISNNWNMPCAYYRYVYTKILAYRPEYHKVRKAMGVSVNIHILRSDNPDSYKLFQIEEEMSLAIEGNEIFNKKLDITRKKRHKSIIFPCKINRMLRNSALYYYSNSSCLFIPEKGLLKFRGGFFDETRIISIAGRNYLTVKDVKQYLAVRYGENYNLTPLVSMKNHYRVIVDEGIKYYRITPFLKHDKIFSDEFWERRNRFIKKYMDDYSKMEEEEKELFSYFYCEKARFKLWKQYYWQKENLFELYRQGRIDELWMRFRILNREVLQGIKQNYVPLFNEDIFALYRKICDLYLLEEQIKKIDATIEKKRIPELDAEQLGKYFASDMCDQTYRRI